MRKGSCRGITRKKRTRGIRSEKGTLGWQRRQKDKPGKRLHLINSTGCAHSTRGGLNVTLQQRHLGMVSHLVYSSHPRGALEPSTHPSTSPSVHCLIPQKDGKSVAGDWWVRRQRYVHMEGMHETVSINHGFWLSSWFLAPSAQGPPSRARRLSRQSRAVSLRWPSSGPLTRCIHSAACWFAGGCFLSALDFVLLVARHLSELSMQSFVPVLKYAR